MNQTDKITIMVISGIITFIIVAVFSVGIVCSIYEARAFNRLTGSNVTWQDAFWLDLRILENVKEN